MVVSACQVHRRNRTVLYFCRSGVNDVLSLLFTVWVLVGSAPLVSTSAGVSCQI